MRRYVKLLGVLLFFGTASYLYISKEVFHSKKNVQTDKELIVREKEMKERDRPDLAIQQNNEMTMDPKLGYPPISRSVKAFENLKGQLRSRSYEPLSVDANWVERGPNNVAGRTRSLMFDPNDPDAKKVWAGAIGGGLWYNEDITDPTQTWSNVDDFLANLAISAMAYDPSNTSTFYVSTGLGYTQDIIGAGIFKSTDGGDTWMQLSSTDNATFQLTQDLIVDNSGHIYVSTYEGVMKSVNGGTSWSNILSGRAGDLEISSDGTLYATFGVNTAGSIHKSIDGGNSWDEITPESGGLRTELAVSESDPDVLYAVADGGTGGTDVRWFYRSVDAGETWEKVKIPLYLNQDCTPSTSHFTRGQAFFDLILAVHPQRPNKVIVGGIDLHVSDDFGRSWSPISYWTGSSCDEYVHADQHAIVFRPGYPNEAIFGNDGGVSYSRNVGSVSNPDFETRNRGYNVTTFYAVAISNESNSNYMLAGAQDNGTQQFTKAFLNDTREATGGDGAYCFIDADDSDIQITSFIYNSYRVSQNGGKSFFSISNDQTKGRFINPSEYDSDSDILYAAGGTNELVKYENISGSPSSGTSVSIATDGRQITTIKASPYTDNLLFVGVRISQGEGKIYRIDNANSTTPIVTEITGQYSGSHGGWVSSIDVGVDDEELLATFSNYGVNSVYYTNDGGDNWDNKEGNLPDIPVRGGVFNPLNRSEVLLATELGVWSTDNINASTPVWSSSNTGLANVRTDMIKVRPSDNMLVVATYGRGVYTSDILVENSYADFVVDSVGYQNNPVQFQDASIKPNSDWDWDFGDGSGTSTDQNPTYSYTSVGTYDVSLSINSNVDDVLKSSAVTILPEIIPPYLPGDGGNFELNQNHFTSKSLYGGINIWELGTPGNELSTTSSGANVWKTKLAEDVENPGYDFASALYTPLFDLTAAGDYKLQFDLGMEAGFCNAPFALQVQYTVDFGENWTTLGDSYSNNFSSNWYNRGDNTGCSIEHSIFPEKIGWSLTTDGLLQVNHSLNDFVGEKIAFRIVYSQVSGYSATGYTKDGVLIDDFQIQYTDATANFIPSRTYGYVGQEISFEYESNGALSFDWNFGDGEGSFDENPVHVFDQPGTYDVELTITNASDGDVRTQAITILPKLPVPFEPEDGGDFESNSSHFYSESQNGTPFEIGMSEIDGKSGTNSGDNAYVTGLVSSEYENDSESYLYTPAFDFTGLGAYEFSFYANFIFEASWDGFVVEYSIDNGESWDKLNNTFIEGWYNLLSNAQSIFGASVPIFSGTSGGFQQYKTDVSFLSGKESVAFRFKFLSDGNTTAAGVAIDDISVFGPGSGDAIPDFSAEGNTGCDGQLVTFFNESQGAYSSISWDFGANATPSTAEGIGPHEVLYEGSGSSTVTLTVEGIENGTQVETKVDFIGSSPLHEPELERIYNGDGTYTLRASLGDSYEWFRDGELLSGESSRTIDVNVGDGGEFSVMVTVGTCQVEAQSLIVNSLLEHSLLIYPNPVKDIIKVEGDVTFRGDFNIYSQTGSLVLSGTFDSSQNIINVSGLNSGIYLLQLNTSKESIVKQVIVRK